MRSEQAAKGFANDLGLPTQAEKAYPPQRQREINMMNWDEQIATRTLWAEARGEPYEGQLAVAHVLLNRLKDGRLSFGSGTLASVCLKRLQFSCWNHDDPQRERMAAMTGDELVLQAMLSVLNEAKANPDPLGALFYFSDSMTIPPKWAVKMRFLKKIGHHSFFTDKAPPIA